MVDVPVGAGGLGKRQVENPAAAGIAVEHESPIIHRAYIGRVEIALSLRARPGGLGEVHHNQRGEVSLEDVHLLGIIIKERGFLS